MRDGALFAVAVAVILALVFVPFLPDGGVREVYDRTVGYQASRPSPFSIWGQVDSLGWLQTAVQDRRRDSGDRGRSSCRVAATRSRSRRWAPP